ncbi:hypothetical protein [Streptomyces sp. NPDC018947]|uniref:hypothetical protein n=1 Tax=Streptomyces sp. NPDC018947 TaxID=3365054 RepID=UPI0037ACB1B8
MDAKDVIQRIQQAVLRATERFLTEHNVDTSALRPAQESVMKQTYNINGPVSGQNNFPVSRP